MHAMFTNGAFGRKRLHIMFRPDDESEISRRSAINNFVTLMERNRCPGCAGDETPPIREELQTGIELYSGVQDVVGEARKPGMLICYSHRSCDTMSHEIPTSKCRPRFL